MCLLKIVAKYSDDKEARKYLEKLRWPDGIACPHCKQFRIMRFSNGIHFKCSDCRKKFTVTTGSAMHATKMPLSHWIAAAYLLAEGRKGIPSTELSRLLEITQKSAWFMLHRLREMMAEHAPETLEGVIQVDETYVGGKNKNRHYSKKKEAGKNVQGRSMWGRTPVVGVLSSSGVYSRPVADVGEKSLCGFIESKVKKGGLILTDEWKSYNSLPERGYTRLKVEHGKGQYVSEEGATTNAMENYWSHLKRTIIGTHHFVSPKHLHRYCAEQDFRHNKRKEQGMERVKSLYGRLGSHLPYSKLVA